MNSESRQKIIEAFKFGYVDRMRLGDPAFVQNIEEIVKEVISCERACSIAPRIHGVTPISSIPDSNLKVESDIPP